MNTDHQAILDFFSAWQQASKAQDLPMLMELMADDVVFLRAGHPPMIGASAFAEAFQAVQYDMEMEILDWRVEEIQVEGRWAHTRTYLSLQVTPQAGGEARRMAGHIMSILRKSQDGRWILSRDANLLSSLS